MWRGPNKTFVPTALVSAAALLLAGCGDDTTSSDAAPQPPAPADVDACSALSSETIEALGLPADIAAPVTAPHPGCEWKGRNAADGANADMLLWVTEPGTLDDFEGALAISGVEVSVWQLDDDSGRFVIPCGPSDLVLNYLPNDGPLDPGEALQLAAKDVIATYSCDA